MGEGIGGSTSGSLTSCPQRAHAREQPADFAADAVLTAHVYDTSAHAAVGAVSSLVSDTFASTFPISTSQPISGFACAEHATTYVERDGD